MNETKLINFILQVIEDTETNSSTDYEKRLAYVLSMLSVNSKELEALKEARTLITQIKECKVDAQVECEKWLSKYKI